MELKKIVNKTLLTKPPPVMKKISLFILSVFAVGVTLAQTVSDFDFVPVITDNNMTVVFPEGTLSDFVGGYLMAFKADGTPVSASSEIAQDGSGGIAPVGTDAMCGCDYLTSGEEIFFAILKTDGSIIDVLTIPVITYAANSFKTMGVESSLWFELDGVCLNDSDADGVCDGEEIADCQEANAFNYNPDATDPLDNCYPFIYGCTDAIAENYSPLINDVQVDVNTDDGSCEYIFGCMSSIAFNYDAAATKDDGSCYAVIEGCTDDVAYNFIALTGDVNVDVNTEDNSCIYEGCMESDADNYNDTATVQVVTQCIYSGCDDENACNYESIVNNNDGSCSGYVGCTNELYLNYDSLASCSSNPASNADCGELKIPGCTNPSADNYDSSANFDDGSCISTGVSPDAVVTSNNMSVIIPVTNNALYTVDSVSGMHDGDILFTVYETSRLEVDLVNYSEVSGIKSAGSLVWNGLDAGMPVFGADVNQDNGYNEGEPLVWLIKREGVIYNANVAYNNDFNGLYEDGAFISIKSIQLGSEYYVGCMNPTFIEYKPLAQSFPEYDESDFCLTQISVGCTDMSAVNYAGVGANPIHDNATNFGNPYLENYTINLNTGAETSVDIAAIYHDVDLCQTQLEGCTDPMALNYEPLATVNKETECDWSLNGMQEYDVDLNGNQIGEVDYNFGSVDPQNEDNGILNSDFDNAQILFDEGYLNPDAHVIDNLADVMQWIDMDEERDADTVQAWSDRYYANDLWWDNRYNDTLDSVAVWFAADEAADAQELADTIFDMQARYDAMMTYFLGTDKVNNAITPVLTDFSDGFHAEGVDEGLVGSLQDSLNYHRAPIVIDLHTQWNTVGYYLHHESSVQLQFIENFGTEIGVRNHINIVKNNEGLFYWPDFNFDGLGMLIPGQGYQVRVKDTSTGKSDFMFHHSISGTYRTLTPTVPEWAIDMPVDVHPNDVRSLVRVVNMLGQEVNPADQFKGEVLLYMYNDGTVEKKMVK